MSRETLLKADDGTVYSLDNLATQKWLEGHYAGLDHCFQWLEQKAASLFATRNRDEAIRLQNLADDMRQELRRDMVKRAEQHKREFPSELEHAK